MEYKSDNSGSPKKATKINNASASENIHNASSSGQSADRVQELLKSWGNQQAINQASLPSEPGCKIWVSRSLPEATSKADSDAKILSFLKVITKIAACFALLAGAVFIGRSTSNKIMLKKDQSNRVVVKSKNDNSNSINFTRADLEKVMGSVFYQPKPESQISKSERTKYLAEIANLEQKISKLEKYSGSKVARILRKLGKPRDVIKEVYKLRKIKKEVLVSLGLEEKKLGDKVLLVLGQKLRDMKSKTKLALAEIKKQRKANAYLVLEREQLKTTLACIDKRHDDVKKISMLMLIDQYAGGDCSLKGVKKVISSLCVLDRCSKIQKQIKENKTRKLIDQCEAYITRIKLASASEEKVITSIKDDIAKNKIDEKLIQISKNIQDPGTKKFLVKLAVILGGVKYVI